MDNGLHQAASLEVLIESTLATVDLGIFNATEMALMRLPVFFMAITFAFTSSVIRLGLPHFFPSACIRSLAAEILSLMANLTKLGILRESGHEHFAGSIVIPVFNETGLVVQLYGRKTTPICAVWRCSRPRRWSPLAGRARGSTTPEARRV